MPNYYISGKEAKNFGWKPEEGNLAEVCPNKMIDGGVFKNRNGHLPEANGRRWFEADINYRNGFRNSQRIVYSNDGLVFVTYDHYQTFFEIV